jgi:Uma2 family endonuclease
MSALAEMPPRTPPFLDDLTPDSGLALRLWTADEYRRMASAHFWEPEDRLVLVGGELVFLDTGLPRLFGREEYYRLGELGILPPDERTELIYGRIIKRMSPMGRPHCVSVIKTTDAPKAVFGDDWAIEPQVSLRLGSGLEPQPDVMVLPGTSDDYTDAPLASNVVLLVEISDSTLRYDRGTKARMYAAEGIPDYWLVHLQARTLEVRRQPENGAYLSLKVYGEEQAAAPFAAPNTLVNVIDLLPLDQSRIREGREQSL